MRGPFDRDSGDSFVAKYAKRAMVYIIGTGIFLVLAVLAAFTCSTSVDNTEVGIVVNNLTGNVHLHTNGGMVFHLPFWLSSVYKLDRSQRILSLTEAHARTEPESGPVNIKTNDGSNVVMDIEMAYQINSSQADMAYRELSDQKNIEDILRALVRSEVRSQLGELSTLEIAEAGPRNAQLKLLENRLRELLQPLGIEFMSINAKSLNFAGDYDKIIRERKEADQILANQKDYQDQATEEGKRMLAEATRDKQSALAQLQGDLNKVLLQAEGEARRFETKAQQQAYQLEREGELAMKTAEAEAAALRSEGLRQAEAKAALMQAFENGGEGLVKEALVKLYSGVTLRARPVSSSDRVDQYQVLPNAPQQAVPAAVPAPQAQPAAPRTAPAPAPAPAPRSNPGQTQPGRRQ